MQRDTAEALTKTSIVLHWVIGLTIMTLLAVGIYMTEQKVYDLYPIHKSIGTLIFLLIVWRIARRLVMGLPPSIGKQNKVEEVMARMTHLSLLTATALMPLSGMTMSIAGGRGLSIFGWVIVESNPDPENPGRVIPIAKELAGITKEVHSLVGWLFVFFVVLHILAALKHHFIYKDPSLQRMLGKKVTRS